jgi:hypothetical protein
MRGRLIRRKIRLHILVHGFRSLVLISIAQALSEFFLPNMDLSVYGRNGTDVAFDREEIFGLFWSSVLLRSTPRLVDTLGSFRENKTGGS